MKLKKVEICNFRSIKESEIVFDPSCRVLVGINESGKSNLLDALSLLSEENQLTIEDERELLPDEANERRLSSISFYFDITDEVENFYEIVRSKITSGNDIITVDNGESKLTIKRYCELFSKNFFVTRSISTEKLQYGMPLHFSTKDYKLIEGWKMLSSDVPNDYTFMVNEETYKLKEMYLIKPKEEWNIPDNYLATAQFQNFHKIASEKLIELLKKKLPKVIYWKYSEEQLLPGEINLEEFIDDPESCRPLKNMFHLAGIKEIETAIVHALSKRNTYALDNLLTGVATKSTEYFQKVWKEYGDIKFVLKKDGDFMKCLIKEKNEFPFQKRSDGFKRLAAFFLTISAVTKTYELNNALILIDEPDAGLHPSGARFLRNELIKLSENNYVVYSTHSIFMIDRSNIGRHLIVKKENEITEIEQADEEGNYVKEEVILRAIGYSVFEHLREINIMLEGRYDRELFEVATKSYKATFFSKIGIIHADGVSSYKHFIPILELAERKSLIISDNDEPAKNQQKEYKNLGFETKWKRYDEISPSIQAKTGEDFLKEDYLIEKLNAVTKRHNNEVKIKENNLPNNNRLKYIRQELRKQGYEDKKVKEVIKDLKEALFSKLTKSKIEEGYQTFLDCLEKYIKENLIVSEIDKKTANTKQ